MSFLDASDLPRASFHRDSSRRYRGLSYNCNYAPEIPVSRPLPPRRDSAIAASLRFTKSLITRSPPPVAMVVTLEPFTAADSPSAMDVHASSLAENPSQEQKDQCSQEWTLAPDNPFAETIKAMGSGNLTCAAGFLTHEVGGLQWSATERKESAGSVEKEIAERLAEAREEVSKDSYDLWHTYLAFLSSAHQDTLTWSDMISWGLSQADEAGKRVYVQASLSEKAKYEKLRFEVKKLVELTLDGGKDERYLMLRPAKV